MDNRKHLEISGPFAGLWVRTAGALRKAGYKSRRKVRGRSLHPNNSIHDYGKYADVEVRHWLGLKSWSECWGTTPLVIRRSWFCPKIFDQD